MKARMPTKKEEKKQRKKKDRAIVTYPNTMWNKRVLKGKKKKDQ